MSQSRCCPSIEHAIENRHSPLEWNDELETCTLSFHDSGGYSILRYCPYCGQAFPFVAAVAETMARTREEASRIVEELRGIQSLTELIARLGQPALTLNLHLDDHATIDADAPVRRHRFVVGEGKLEVLAQELQSGRIDVSVAPIWRKTTDRHSSP